MKTEQENCTVTVRGIQRVEGDEDVVELVTGGRFTCHGGRWLIRYEEKGQVILLRTGAVHSQLMVEEGKRHQCTYDTGCGTIILGVSGSRILSELNEDGGTLEFHYSLDVNTALVSENDVYVAVFPR